MPESVTWAGGMPDPKATRSPVLLTTTIANPNLESSGHVGLLLEPSVYHTRSARDTSGGSESQLNDPTGNFLYAGTFTHTKPLVFRMLFLLYPRDWRPV